MSWLKQSDAAANHPIVLRALEMEDVDDRILNEVYGFVNRCATQAAAHQKDYIIEVGTARAMAGSLARYNTLVEAAVYCGYWTVVTVEIEGQQRKAFKLVEDDDLFHMILKAEADWDKQRQRDNRDPTKTGPVRLRDGDACRYCGKVVAWSADRKSGRRGTIDHTVPGQEGTIETMVVCCGECNSRRRNDPDSVWKTLPAPAEPLIGPATAKWLADKCGIIVTPTYTRIPTIPTTRTAPAQANGSRVAEEPPAVEQPAPAAPAEDEATVSPAPSSDSATAPDHVQVEQSQDLAATDSPAADGPVESPGQNPDPESEPITDSGSGESGFAGSGRVGSGRAGKGREPAVPPHPQARAKRRRPRNRKKPGHSQATTAAAAPVQQPGSASQPQRNQHHSAGDRPVSGGKPR